MKLLPLLLIVPLFASCASRFSADGSPAPAPIEVVAMGNANPERKIKKTGSMSIRSHGLKESSEKSIALVARHRGIITSSSLTEDDFDATIKVPAGQLETLMESLTTIGKVTRKRISMDDITEEYLDLEAALKNKRALRDRLRNLLNQTKDVEELLKVEEQLARVQTELDQMEARIKRMRSQVAQSTLNLSIERTHIPGPVGALKKGTSWVFGKMMRLN